MKFGCFLVVQIGCNYWNIGMDYNVSQVWPTLDQSGVV